MVNFVTRSGIKLEQSNENRAHCSSDVRKYYLTKHCSTVRRVSVIRQSVQGSSTYVRDPFVGPEVGTQLHTHLRVCLTLGSHNEGKIFFKKTTQKTYIKCSTIKYGVQLVQKQRRFPDIALRDSVLYYGKWCLNHEMPYVWSDVAQGSSIYSQLSVPP